MPEKAAQVAKQAFDDAILQLDSLSEDIESTMWMQKLRVQLQEISGDVEKSEENSDLSVAEGTNKILMYWVGDGI
jgi:hypothetical protein